MAIKIRVRNFQSVEDAELVVDGLTVVTGTNNAGKSAFFRAVRGAFINARGYDFVRHGQNHCRVDITFDDGKTLTWKKGKNINTYIVNGKEYPKVNVGVPPEARVFGIEPMTVGKTELWPQIAPAITGVSFLLHEPGSVIAEAVADVRRVNQLSRALKACESDRRSTKSRLKLRRGDATTLAERREVFIGLDEVVDEITALEDRIKKTSKITQAITNIEKLRDRYREAAAAVNALEGLEEAGGCLPTNDRMREAQEASGELLEAVRLRDRWSAAHEKVASLDGLEAVEEVLPSDARIDYVQQFRKALGVTVELAMRYEEAQTDLQNAQEAQRVLEAIDLDEASLIQVDKIKKALKNTQNLRDRYAKSREAVIGLEREIQDREAELAELTTSVASVLGTYDECPTCGGGLDHVH